nr:hypothetical protein Iba_chr12cCG16560 [Ipomoea batatas]
MICVVVQHLVPYHLTNLYADRWDEASPTSPPAVASAPASSKNCRSAVDRRVLVDVSPAVASAQPRRRLPRRHFRRLLSQSQPSAVASAQENKGFKFSTINTHQFTTVESSTKLGLPPSTASHPHQSTTVVS